MEKQRWDALLTSLNLQSSSATDTAYKKLVAAYSQKHRHYHGVEHINACLKHLDLSQSDANSPQEIEIALWFHDAVYQPYRSDNERASAEWAKSFLVDNDAPAELCQRVYQLIMATEHHAPAQTADESLLVDIDLSILGSSPEVYKQFETNVRKEYKWIPKWIYNKKRAEVLNGFLQRERIYTSERFFSERESQARDNLTTAINKLN